MVTRLADLGTRTQARTQDAFYDFLPSAAFTVLLLIAYLWPRYLYLKIGGFGVSLFIIGTLLFFIVLVPVALMYSRVMSNLIALISLSSYVWLAFTLTLSWRFLTSFIAPPIFDEVPFTTFLRSHLAIAGFFLIGSVFFLDGRIRRAYPYLIVTVIFPICLLGIVEYLTQIKILVLLGLNQFAASNASLEGILSETFRGGQYRVQSLFSQPLVYGQFTGAVLPICLAVATVSRGRWRFAAWLAFTLCLFGVWSSTARSGVIVAFVAVMSYVIIRFSARSRNKRWRLLACLLVIVYVGGITSQLVDSTSLIAGRTSEEQISSDARTTMLARTFEEASKSPVLGFGDGSSKWLAGLVGKNGDIATIDSYYLSIILCNGYTGLTLTVFLLIAIIYLGVQNAMYAPLKEDRIINAGLASLVIALSFGFSVLTIEDNLVFVYLAAAYMMADRTFYARQDLKDNNNLISENYQEIKG